jgi:hypothetical protein
MFKVGQYQIVSSRIKNGLEAVTEETVKTADGRLKYFQFLKNNPNLDPIRQLYGTSATIIPQELDIEKHIKRLIFYVHPDKVSEEEKKLCTELFTMINNAHTVYKDVQLGGVTLIPGAFFASSDPQDRLSSYIKEQQWIKAKEFLTQIPQEKIASNPHLASLCTIVYIRFGELEKAAECGLIFSEKAADILRGCQKLLNSPDEVFLSLEDKKQKLLQSLQELHQLPAPFQEKGGFSYPPMFSPPYQLYVNLKECSSALKDFFGYEKYLREAIRSCPDGLNMQKQPLIEELINWTKDVYKDLNRIKSQLTSHHLGSICSSFLSDLKTKGLSNYDFSTINTAIDEFVENKEANYINKAVQHVQNIIDKRNYTLSSYLPSSIKAYTDSVGAYPQTTIDQLKELLLPLRGLMNYVNGNKLMAASDFLTAKKWLFLGLIQCELDQYGKAILSWKKVVQASEGYIEQLQNTAVNSLILVAMNLNDMNLEHSSSDIPLGELDEIQEVAMRTFCNKN